MAEDKDFETFKLDYAYERDQVVVMLESTLEAGSSAIKSAFLMNGGATVALLAFISNLAKDTSTHWPSLPTNATYSLLVFAIATGVVGVASGLRYITQSIYTDASQAWLRPKYELNIEEYESYLQDFNKGKKLEKRGSWFNRTSVSLVIISYAFFFLGIYLFSRSFISIV